MIAETQKPIISLVFVRRTEPERQVQNGHTKQFIKLSMVFMRND